MKINSTNNQNFGWNIKAHYEITNGIADKIPNLRKYAKILATASYLPDLKPSQTSALYEKAHTYYGKDFCAYDLVPQNASDYYFDSLSKAISLLRSGDNLAAMNNAGNALHFLQDMALPLHTKEECQGLLKLPFHIKYENLATDNNMIKGIADRLNDVKNENFQDCFLDAYKKSSSKENPYGLTIEGLNSSIRESVENACEHTFQFLKRLSGLKNVPYSKQEEVFAKEALESFHI